MRVFFRIAVKPLGTPLRQSDCNGLLPGQRPPLLPASRERFISRDSAGGCHIALVFFSRAGRQRRANLFPQRLCRSPQAGRSLHFYARLVAPPCRFHRSCRRKRFYRDKSGEGIQKRENARPTFDAPPDCEALFVASAGGNIVSPYAFPTPQIME